MSPEPTPDKEPDFSHFFDKSHNQQYKTAAIETAPSRFKISKKFYVLAGILLLFIIIQILIIVVVRPPQSKTTIKQKKNIKTNKTK